MIENEPLVSIVTPFYNTDEYLAECIESVLVQTYQNWEYILVNNCSTDRSAEIAQSYVEKDKRVRLIHNKSFLTQVQNYNHALRQISSESKYCKIVQADDWIFPECISKMVEVADNNPSVGIVGAYRLQGRYVSNSGLCYKKKFIQGKAVCREQILNNRDYFGSPSTILIRSEILKNHYPFYNENHIYEDTEACFEIMNKWDFGFVHQILVYERIQDDSISSNIIKYDHGWILGSFIKTKKYGPIYLSTEEYENCFSKIKDIYFTFLAENIFFNNDKKFWEYHKKGLFSIGLNLSKITLIKYIIWELLDIFFNPKKTVGRLYKNKYSSLKRPTY
jgi:glycosyltransferase involved in cell wall biosynthesis